MNFWERIKAIWKRKKKQPFVKLEIEVAELKLVLMRNILRLKQEEWFQHWMEDKMFEWYKCFEACIGTKEAETALCAARRYKEILDEIESVTEEKIFIAEENLRLLKVK